jgi:hypothetical protein
MDPITIATLVITGAEKAAELAKAALDAYREHDDEKALALLDEALAHFDAGSAGVRVALEAVKARIQARIDAKFPETPAAPAAK